MDSEREKALNIALNKISGEFDLPKLTEILQELKLSGIGYTITGFDDKEVDKLSQKMARLGGQIEEDNFDVDKATEEAEAEPLTKPGDIWLLGKHRLMCGDSTDIGAVAKLMDGKKAHMIFTDPPWNVNFGGTEHPSWKRRNIKNDNMSKADFGEFLRKVFKSAASVCLTGAMLYCVMSAQEWGNLHLALEDSGVHWSSTVIWYKDSLVLSRKDYHTQFEPIFYGWLNGDKRLCPLEDRQQSDVWQFDRPKKSDEHPTMKPIALVGRAITNSSRQGDAVLDMFGGSGTTILACEQTERVGYDTKKITAPDGRVWKIMSDGSINCQQKYGRGRDFATKDYSCELVSPILTYREDINTIQELVRKLRKAGAFANDSCGIHIALPHVIKTK